jgi:amino acid transporter
MTAITRPRSLARAAQFRHVYGQGLLSNAPLASSLVALTSAAAYAGGATPLAYLLGLFVVVFWINTPYQFSKRLASASGMYYYVAKGVGTEAGYLAGLAYVAYYFMILTGNGVFVSVLITEVLGVLGVHLAVWVWVPFLVAMVVPVAVLTILGIRLSLNYGIVTVVLEIAVLVIVSLVIIARVGVHNTGLVYTSRYLNGGFSQLGVGILVAAFGMSGATATVYLGEETRAPQAVIKRSLIWATATVIALYILVSYAFTVGWGPAQMHSFVNAGVPGLLLVQRYLGVGPMLIVTLLALNSLVGVGVASMIVVSRLLFSFGRAGLLPDQVGTVSRWQTPAVAILGTSAAAVVVGALLVIWQGPVAGYIFGVLLATMAEFIAHVVGNLGLPFYEWRQRAFQVLWHLALPALSIATILVGVYTTFVPISFPTVLAPIVVIAFLILGWIQVALTRRVAPGRARRIDGALAEIGSEIVA